MAEPTIRFNANLPPDVYEMLAEMADRDKRTMTDVAVAAIRVYYANWKSLPSAFEVTLPSAEKEQDDE